MKIQTSDRLGIYVEKSLGKTRHITPEGFLLCEGVAIGRTGVQIYRASDLPGVEPDATGMIRVERLPEEVFRPESMASYEGKSVTVYHPEELITPETWKKCTVGTARNIRRGEGKEDDLLLADLLITTADAIAYANKEFPQLSSGYEAEYEQVKPGHAIQRNIIGNHVSMLPLGRAGARCAIKDEDTQMSRSAWDRLLTAVRAKDKAAAKAELEAVEVDATPTNDSADLSQRMEAVETGLADIKQLLLTKDKAPEKTQAQIDAEAAAAAAEAAKKKPPYTADALQGIVSKAEILAPGISIPTTDALQAEGAADQFMQQTLTVAQVIEGGKDCIDPFLMGRELRTLTTDALLGVFNGAAELKRIRNNTRSRVAGTKDSKPLTAEQVNEANRKFWEARQ